jgi:chemotaxis protein MotA
MAEEAATLHIRRVRSSMDMATVAGLLCAFVFIATAIVLGGTPGSFINPPAILIVIGGTLAVTTACFSIEEMKRTVRVVMQTFMYSSRDPSDAAIQVLKVAEMARKQGVLALQNILGSIQAEPFLHKGVSMVVDGTPGGEVEAIMRREMFSTQQRHTKSTNVLRKMGEFSPAMVLIGLVQMLGNLDDPSTIGRQENPRRLKMLLNSLLSPTLRVRYFD